jgi:protein-S-isoprenylcysteine O-methyltransferase Ste14
VVRADLHHPERHRAIEAWHYAARGQRSIAAPAMRYIALAALLLAACSGGGNNPTPPNPPWSKVAAHVLRLAGILAYLDWAWRTAGRSLLVGEPNQIGACFVTAGLFLAAHPCRAAADRVERPACQCTSCASLDLQEW